ncbi:eva-1 homolog Bb [Hippocampus comes]|uniref:eva-1 homolog Bb n=1 Tax=Hippocampus comes TaxID=109280 RepID=UPI00094EDFBA|nr:PREDICTED: protein eva-1 homolog B-like [Hippocampus comes]XP_019738803.1 PREDICTED: protein eva-1 homolog B-like [Hippocampus comes]
MRMEPIRKDMELLSNSMATYAHIKANPESFALYFMMGVCFGLLMALCLLVAGITCRSRRRVARPAPSPERRQLKESSEEEEEAEEDESIAEEEEVEGSHKMTLVQTDDRSRQSDGTLKSVDVFASVEELEKARRLEERERIVREIWRNGQPDILVTGTGTIGRVHYH